MEWIRGCIKQVTNKEYLPLWIFAAVQVVYHLLMREPEGSDAMWFFRNQLDAYSLKEYLTSRYDTWSSRLLIEAVLVYVSRDIVLWKVLDWVVWVFLAWAVIGLFPDEKRASASWLTVGFLLLYPMWDLRTAGWIATGVNYTWPLACGIFSLHGTARALERKQTHPAMWLLYALAAVYGANMEQMAAVLLAVNVCAAVYFWICKERFRLYASTVIGAIAAALEIGFILSCPGNAARKTQEIINWMPNFGSYHLWDKISMGFVDTMHHLLASGNLLYLCYALLLAWLVFVKTKDVRLRAAALAPVALNIGLTFYADMLKEHFSSFAKLMEKNAFICGSNYQLAANYIPMILYLLVIGCMLLSLVIVCESYLELCSQTLLLALALATRVVMGFTPTIYVSQERTFFYLYVLLGISASYLVVQNGKRLRSVKGYETFRLAGALLVAAGIVMNLVEIGGI